MDPQDLEPQKKARPKRDLDPMSIEELRDYISELKIEIERVEADIAAKQAHREGIEGLFKT